MAMASFQHDHSYWSRPSDASPSAVDSSGDVLESLSFVNEGVKGSVVASGQLQMLNDCLPADFRHLISEFHPESEGYEY